MSPSLIEVDRIQQHIAAFFLNLLEHDKHHFLYFDSGSGPVRWEKCMAKINAFRDQVLGDNTFYVPNFSLGSYCPFPREIHYFGADNPAKVAWDALRASGQAVDDDVYTALARHLEEKI